MTDITDRAATVRTGVSIDLLYGGAVVISSLSEDIRLRVIDAEGVAAVTVMLTLAEAEAVGALILKAMETL